VVVLSSILARIAVPGYTGYSASKAGLLGLVRSFAAELAPLGIQVNAICPGWVDTEMAWTGLDAAARATGSTREEAYRDAMLLVPTGRMGRPEDVAGTVAWLLSPDARGMVGQAIDQIEHSRLLQLITERAASLMNAQACSLMVTGSCRPRRFSLIARNTM